MSIVARHMSRIKASPAAVISAKAMEMARAGRDVIALSAGEPDFDTPDHVKAAAVRAIGEGKTKYPPLTGIPELREAICRKLERENGLRYAPDQVLVCNGGKQVIYNALTATLDPGDEVVIPAPFWVSYPDMVLLAGAQPGGGPHRRGERVPIGAGPTRSSDHREDQVADPEQPLQSVRGGLLGAGHRRDRRRAAAASARVGARRRHLRAHHLQRRAVLDDGAGRTRSARAHPDHERALEGLLHDRLAHRLRGGPEGADRGDGEDPVADHQRRFQHQPVGRGGSAGRRSDVHPGQRRRVPGTARSGRLAAEPGGRTFLPVAGTARSISTSTAGRRSASGPRRARPSGRTPTSRSISSRARRSRWCTARRSACLRTSASPTRSRPSGSGKPASRIQRACAALSG